MATIKDVAALAQVVPSTVSRVLNNMNYGSSELRERVLNACKQLDYVPNAFAQSMVSKVSRLIGIISPDVSNTFYANIIHEAQDLLKQAGYDVIIYSTYGSEEKERACIQSILSRKVDGLIINSPQHPEHFYQHILNREIPVVFTDVPSSSFKLRPIVAVDQHEAGYLAGEYLAKRGHREIAIFGSGTLKSSTELRIQGIRQALQDNGVAINPDWVRRPPFSAEKTKEAAKEIFALGERPTAAIATSNTTTLGLLLALKELKLRVKQDVSVIGFGDEKWYELLEPKITVIAQPIQVLGGTAASLLLRQMREHNSQENSLVTMKPFIIERDSVL